MTIYTVHVFPDARKLWRDSTVAGHFTSKAALREAVKAHAEEFGISDMQEFWRAFNLGKWYWVNTYAETATIDIEDANAWRG